MSDQGKAALLGVDWGLSRVRAMRIARDGTLLDLREADDGVLVGRGSFEGRLSRHLEGWQGGDKPLPVLMSGMIGSNIGWMEAPYVQLPAGAGELASALVRVTGVHGVYLVPGVSQSAPFADVMRGEEVEVAGLVAQVRRARMLACLPGTHSKWIDLEHGRICGFRTYMTGELYALLLAQGTLAPGVPQAPSEKALRRGALADGSATQVLFRARAERLQGLLDGEHMAEYLSGALIGAEVRAERERIAPDRTLVLVAGGRLAKAYATAMKAFDLDFMAIDPAALSARGLAAIARSSGLIE